MAFQSGSRVDPRLLDYSGYTQGVTQGAAISAQALAQLGAQVGDAVDKLRTKKEEKKQKGFIADSFIKMGDANAELGEMILPGFADAEEDEKKLAANTYIDGLGLANATKLNMALLSSFLGDDDKEPQKIGNVSTFMNTIDDLPNYEIDKDKGKIFYDPTPGGMFTGGDKREVRADDPIFRDYEGGQEFYDIFYDPKGIR
tara:strand:+ start:132 stop:731 length:600 start_codon:yes stop_codon:yes gene_type:complete